MCISIFLRKIAENKKHMNRIVIIGNGFDLAHGLKTSYKDFIDWYWEQKVNLMCTTVSNVITDILCSLKTPENEYWNAFAFNNGYFRLTSPRKVVDFVLDKSNGFSVEKSAFFDIITKSIEMKGWVDIENEYYKLLADQSSFGAYDEHPEKLNEELDYIIQNLTAYLSYIERTQISDNIKNAKIQKLIFGPINQQDVAVNEQSRYHKMLESRCHTQYLDENKDIIIDKFGYNEQDIKNAKQFISSSEMSIYYGGIKSIEQEEIPAPLLLPNRILLLNFNYTHTADIYLPECNLMTVNHIHGELLDPSSIIFGYGDELDDNYKFLLNKNDNSYLTNIKSIKYLEKDCYRDLLRFIESDAYQIYIMGHSCGNSDRTLLNTLFEHKNCVSVKPFYYKDLMKNTDNYTDIVQNISRNFTDMKLMRDRVVNKTYCEPFSIRE